MSLCYSTTSREQKEMSVSVNKEVATTCTVQCIICSAADVRWEQVWQWSVSHNWICSTVLYSPQSVYICLRWIKVSKGACHEHTANQINAMPAIHVNSSN